MKKYLFTLRYFKKKKMLSLVFLMIFSSVLALCPPYIISFILDNGVTKMLPKTIIVGGIFLVCIYAGSFAVNYFISQTLTKTSSYFIANLKNDLFTQILKLPMEFFDNQQTGYILERIKEADALNVFFLSGIFEIYNQRIFICWRIGAHYIHSMGIGDRPAYFSTNNILLYKLFKHPN